MSDKVLVLRDAVVKITQMLSGKGIKVTQRGINAYVNADHTGRPVLVNLPYLPDNASDELCNAIQGFLDHEVAHILFTDFILMKKAIDGNYASLFNMLEDARIEKAMAQRFSGCAHNLSTTGKFFLDKYTMPMLEEAIAGGDSKKAIGVLMVPLIRGMSGQFIFKEFMDDKMHYVDSVYKKFADLESKIQKAASTKDCLELAEEITKRIREDEPKGKGGKGETPEDKGEGASSSESKSSKSKSSKGKSAPKKDEEEDDSEDSSSGESSDSDDAGDSSGGSKSEKSDEETEGEEKDERDKSDEEGDEDKEEEDSESEEEEPEGFEDEEEKGDESEPEDDELEEEESEELDDEGDDEDDGDSTDEDSESDGKFILDELDKDGANDYDKLMSRIISDETVDAAKDAEYLVYTKDDDLIEPLHVGRDYRPEMFTDLASKVDHMVGPLQKDLERAIAARSLSTWEAGRRSGRLHAANLSRLATGDDRVFRRKHESTSKDVAVELVIDASGSMGGSRINLATQSAYALSQVLERIGIKHEIICFSTGYIKNQSEMDDELEKIKKSGGRTGGRTGFSRYEPLYMPIIKSFDERLTSQVKERFGWLPNSRILRNNVDGECVEIAARRLRMRRETGKVMIVLSDGLPCAAGSSVELNRHLTQVVKNVTKSGVNVVGIGIQTDSVKRFYPKNVVINNVDELPDRVIKELRHLLVQ